MPLTEEFITVNQARLWTATQGKGLPMLLCHGGPGGYDDLAPLSAGLKEISRVHRYDQRGCGLSEDSPPYTLEAYLADLDALREHWGFASWIVGGHSWGAGLALAYALAYPDRVSGLIYLAGTGISMDWKAEYRANRLARLTPPERERWQWLRSQLKSNAIQDPARRQALDEEYTQLYRMTDYARREAVSGAVSRGLQANQRVNGLLNADWEDFLRRLNPGALQQLSMPALVVHGELDPRPAWAARQVAEGLPNATWVELSGVGHYLHVEAPERLLEVVRKFLGRVAS